MSEWKTVSLGEKAKEITVGFVGPMASEYVEKGIPFLRSQNVVPFSIDYDGIKYITDEFHEKLKKSALTPGDVVIVRTGKPGASAVIPKSLPVVNCSDLVIVRCGDELDPNFISYFINSITKSHVDANLVGAVQQHFNVGAAKQILIPDIDVIHQRAIASVLSSLDDKIDLLHRQNATLEKMAETLFRQWFVEEAKEEWETSTLYDAIELVGGGTPKTSVDEYWNGKIKWLSGGDISNNHKSIVSQSEKTITDEGLKNSSAKLLPKFSTIISARGTVGKYCILSEPMAFSQSNYGIKPKYKDCFFFTYLLVNHSVEELNSAAYGSVFDTITTNTFKGMSISLPTEFEIKEFEISVTPFFNKILNNQTQIRTLTTLRDTLLPKLMSGEVRVAT